MNLTISTVDPRGVERGPVEVVERKGRGHPDTICDALAEKLSLALSGFYREHCGRILHHNVDKVLLRGGAARPRFGGGEVLEPIEIYLCGRAVPALDGVRVPFEELAVEGTRDWFRTHLHALDPERHLRVHSLIRPGSAALNELFLRSPDASVALANDTSVGVGYAPLSRLEALVYDVERDLNAAPWRREHPECGEDVKVMGVRAGARVQLTVACAMVDRHLRDVDAYRVAKTAIAAHLEVLAARHTSHEVAVAVNAADDLEAGSVYLTVTGTSAEAGDDGEAGRGNRANGLITPYRPMTMESVAGKNPVSHVGKLYNLAATLLAAELVERIPQVSAAQCYLVSRIGSPVDEPQVVDVRVGTTGASTLAPLRPAIEEIVAAQLARTGALWRELLEGSLALERFPPGAEVPARSTAEHQSERQEMVRLIEREARETAAATGRAAFSKSVISALARVPRHAFVPDQLGASAYADGPLPIGHGQTISQPYIVALMTDLLDLRAESRVLEIGTGSGYQAAVLAELAAEVYSMELVPELVERARTRLAQLGYANVEVRAGDGYDGWPEHAPYDAIVVTAAAKEVPAPLLAQLRRGGRMVIPVGSAHFGQTLTLLTKDAAGGVHERPILSVAFVPFRRGS